MNKTGQMVSIVFEDLSRNSVFFRTEVKLCLNVKGLQGLMDLRTILAQKGEGRTRHNRVRTDIFTFIIMFEPIIFILSS